MIRIKRAAALCGAVWIAAMTVEAEDRSQARSMVISQQGIVATSQTLASQAGAQVLARGGSAIDAAIAANAALTVVEPMSSGIGGDLFAIYWEAKTGKLTGINASGWAPKGLTIDFLKSQGAAGDAAGRHSFGDGAGLRGRLERLHKRFGRLPWRELFQPAVYYAENGFPVTEIISDSWQVETTRKLRADANARPCTCRTDAAPRLGQLFRNPELARAFKLIAAGRAPTRSTAARSHAPCSILRSGWAEPFGRPTSPSSRPSG